MRPRKQKDMLFYMAFCKTARELDSDHLAVYNQLLQILFHPGSYLMEDTRYTIFRCLWDIQCQ